MPKAHLKPPEPNEEFDTFNEAAGRCHNYAFASGYCLVVTKKDLKKDLKKEMRARLQCKHHGTETRNARKTTEDDRNKKDKKGRRLARPNTYKSQLDCRYCIGIAYRKIVGGGGRKAWILSVPTAVHSCDPTPNPFSFHEYKDRCLGRQETFNEALDFRTSGKSYKDLNEVLVEKDLPVISR